MIRLTYPDISEEDVQAVVEALRSGQLVQAARVAAFESEVGKWTDGGEIVAVSSGTAALHLALLALGVGPGDAVGVASYSWPATANAIVLCGARPIFVDIERTTFGMDPDALERSLRREPRFRAIIPVHVFGKMSQMEAISSLAERHGVPLVEDAACALGAGLMSRPAGTWGTLGCFSFHPRKAATTGEGGAVRTADPRLARILRALRNHGQDPDAATSDFIMPGFNARMTEFAAALGRSQMQRYDALLRARRQRAAHYDELLAELPVECPVEGPESSHIYQSYVVLLRPNDAPRRSAIIAELRRRGIETAIGTHHMPHLSYFAKALGHSKGDFPCSEDISARALALPMSLSLTEADQERVVLELRGLLTR